MKRLRLNSFNKRSAPKPLVTLPLTLDRKRIYILPTRHGSVFMLVLLTMLVGSINYKNNLGFLLTFLLGSMAFVSILHTYRNLLGLQIVSVTSKQVFAGDRATFIFRVRIEKPGRAAVTFSLPNTKKIEKDVEAVKDNWIHILIGVSQRGIFTPGALSIATRYPLGFFRAWSTIHFDGSCLVYPRPLPGPLETADDGHAAADKGGIIVPGAEDFQGLKAYQSGDPFQHISWKTFSRGQGLFTKIFAGPAGSTVMLDFNALRELSTERKLSRLCDMVLKACRYNLVFGLKLPGKTIDPDRGEAHRQKCLKALALYATPASPEIT